MRSKRTYRHGAPRTFVCPHCLCEFPVEEMVFYAPATGEKKTGSTNIVRRLTGMHVVPPALNGHIMEKLCPGQNCGKVLPKTTGMEPSLVIGMAGAQVSGKSTYIATLIHRLSTEIGNRFEVGVLAADPQTTKRFATEFKPLLDDRMPMESTVDSPPPLIYNLTFHGSLWGEKLPRSVTLALYDTAGENFRDPVKVRTMAAYLSVAAGVIFVVDPLQSERVRQVVGPQVRLPTLKDDNLPDNIIQNLIGLLDKQGIVKGAKPFQTPVAVTLTKADVLRDVGLIDRHARWNRTDAHARFFDTALHENLEGTMRELFKQIEPAAYHNVHVRFENHAFFGVSSTGCSPDPKTKKYPTIAPWRVEDPLLWLLAEIGVIPQGRGSEISSGPS